MSRQSYYQAQQRCQQVKTQVIALVQQQRRLMPRVGTRKLYYLLKEPFQQQRIKVGRDSLFSCLRDEDLLVRPVRSYHKTTDSGHWMRDPS
ncbi:hypothetical protein AWR27_09730 [Spirosoma montaniterrae]|uniref:HTH-like domain-containing protein n=1 Tax=Spirosoma montaniterrae TaxID=1178516 RepID=A0A1P9WW75_9BACT|nr:hypothetical protein AWR27_09730 [Spirosoma montaniterrae]